MVRGVGSVEVRWCAWPTALALAACFLPAGRSADMCRRIGSASQLSAQKARTRRRRACCRCRRTQKCPRCQPLGGWRPCKPRSAIHALQKTASWRCHLKGCVALALERQWSSVQPPVLRMQRSLCCVGRQAWQSSGGRRGLPWWLGTSHRGRDELSRSVTFCPSHFDRSDAYGGAVAQRRRHRSVGARSRRQRRQLRPAHSLIRERRACTASRAVGAQRVAVSPF